MKKIILLKQLNLKNLPRFFRILYLMVFVLAGTVAQAQNTVSGTVTDETGSGLPGVNVLVKGTTNGTTSDANGQYSLSVPDGTENPVLIFSFIGYTSEEIPVSGRTTIEVQLVPSIKSLQEIVVIGYGEQRQEAVTGSVVSIKSAQISEVPSPNLTQALQGRLAGVDMSQTSSKPGASMQIRIRGTRSLNASNDRSAE